MSIVHKSRIGLIRFAKVFPFILCSLVTISMCETIVRMMLNDFVYYDNGITPNTPISWIIARHYDFGIYSVLAATYLSISFETCVWNKASDLYLLAFLKQQTFFPTIELEPTTIYIICIINIVITSFLCYKGVKQLMK